MYLFIPVHLSLVFPRCVFGLFVMQFSQVLISFLLSHYSSDHEKVQTILALGIYVVTKACNYINYERSKYIFAKSKYLPPTFI